MKPNDSAIRKRTQITKANRTMFIWIAVASALIGVGLVISIFLFQNLLYNEKVLAEKLHTVTVLDHNNSVVNDLQDKIRVLDTNQALASVKANPSDQTLQVVLDALPSEPNSLALGSSLQNKLLIGINGLQVQSLQVDQVQGAETSGASSTTPTTTSSTTTATSGAQAITFQFTIQGSPDAMKQTLSNLERSIRTMVVTSVRVESSNMVVQAKAFYQPEKSIELTDKVVPR